MNSNDPHTAPRTFVRDLRKGHRVRGEVFLVESSNFKQTRNQKYFIQLSLRDRTGSIRGVRWEATEELYASFGADDFVRVDGRVEEFQGQPQLVVDEIERAEPENVDFAEFLPVSVRDIDEMETELRQAIGEVRRPGLRNLLLAVVGAPEIRPGLRRAPAGKALHHAWVGGLLEHICSLLGSARALAAHYPRLDRDLLYAGAILHDIGKVFEIAHEGLFHYTDRGQLVGHVAIGLQIVRDKARQVDELDEALLVELEHIIASHHGLLEHGSVKLPMTAEAVAFHALDDLDARLAGFETIEAELPRNDQPDDAPRWSDFKHHLGRKVFFPRPLRSPLEGAP